MKKNNKNIIINIVFIIVLILFSLFYVIEILFLKSTIKNSYTIDNIDWSFIPSTLCTIFLIILFQIHFYFNISKKYKYVSSQELTNIITTKINENYFNNKLLLNKKQIDINEDTNINQNYNNSNEINLIESEEEDININEINLVENEDTNENKKKLLLIKYI